MTIRWTPNASADLECLHAYITEENPDAAAETIDRIVIATEALRRHPEMGRRGRIGGTRELVVFPFVIAYRSKNSCIPVLAVIHGACRWPDSL